MYFFYYMVILETGLSPFIKSDVRNSVRLKHFPKATQLLHGKSELEPGAQSISSRVISIMPCLIPLELPEHHRPISDRNELSHGCGGQKSKGKVQAGLDSLLLALLVCRQLVPRGVPMWAPLGPYTHLGSLPPFLRSPS